MKFVPLFLALATLTTAADRVVPREGTEWCNIWMPNANKHDLPRVLLIGDSINDAETARNAGSPVFIVPYGYNEGQELRGLDCDAFIDDLTQVLKYVKMVS